MESSEVIQIIQSFLFTAAILALWYFYKKDAKNLENRVEGLEEAAILKAQADMSVAETLASLKTFTQSQEKRLDKIEEKV